MLTLPAHRGLDPPNEAHAHVYRHLARLLALAVPAARSARATSGPYTLRAPRRSPGVASGADPVTIPVTIAEWTSLLEELVNFGAKNLYRQSSLVFRPFVQFGQGRAKLTVC